MDRLIAVVEKAIGLVTAVITGLVVLVLMAHVVANAAMRSFFNQPIEGTLEYVGNWYLPVIVLLGLVLAQQRGQHIEASLLFDKAPKAVQREFQLFTYLLMFIMTLLFAWYGYVEAWNNYTLGLTAGVSGVTIWPVTYAVPIGFLLFAVQILLDAVKLLRGRPARDGTAATADETAVTAEGTAVTTEEGARP